MTLASIVEKETGKVDERPHVAGVFVNRLNKHMKLQSDPTIVYGLVFGKGTLGHSITKAELEQATPYNTYTIDGLPPGPICNPGRAALEAVANPLKTKDLYFVADGTGGHAFAETIEQHLKNVAAYRQIQQDAKDRIAPDVNADAPTPTPTGAPGGKGKPHAEAEPVDPKVFAALVPMAAGRASRTRSPQGWPSSSRASARSMRWRRSAAAANMFAALVPVPAGGKADAIPAGLAKLAERQRSLDQAAAANASALDKGLSQLASRERTAQALMGEAGRSANRISAASRLTRWARWSAASTIPRASRWRRRRTPRPCRCRPAARRPPRTCSTPAPRRPCRSPTRRRIRCRPAPIACSTPRRERRSIRCSTRLGI